MKITETPLLKQYREMKRKHPDAILLFRVGDFYETFSDDAVAVSEILNITLTRRANGRSEYVELAGFPHHALDTYLPRLVRAGKRVAICEQLDDPKVSRPSPAREPDPRRDAKLLPASFPADDNRERATRLFGTFLAAFIFVVDKLYVLDKMMRDAREICRLSQELPVAPNRAFADCCYAINHPSQPKLPL